MMPPPSLSSRAFTYSTHLMGSQVPEQYSGTVMVYMFNYGRRDPMPTFVNASITAGGVWKANGWLVSQSLRTVSN